MAGPWQPAADMQRLRQRARLLAEVRQFFAERDVLEVETPLLCRATGTDPNLDFFSSQFHSPPHAKPLFLQTSPEFAMKRLLAAGSAAFIKSARPFATAKNGFLLGLILEWYRRFRFTAIDE